ncbi:MAG: hypothetical protein AB7G44_07135 [Bacteroidia bacterium]
MVEPILLKTKQGPELRLCIQKRGAAPGHLILIDIISTPEELEAQIKILEKAKADWIELKK